MAKNKLVAPVVKWVGGKRQLIDEITPLLPKKIEFYWWRSCAFFYAAS